LAACDSGVTPPDSAAEEQPALEAAEDGRRPRSVRRQLRALRAYANPFRNLNRAKEAGFDTQVTQCRDNPPIGGMGYHFANLGRIDGAQPKVLEPEILVFAPRRNGRIALAAVEYIVPFALWDGEPPRLFGQEFRANNNDQVWQLHVWLWRYNPAGLFEDWNPRVSCGDHQLDG